MKKSLKGSAHIWSMEEKVKRDLLAVLRSTLHVLEQPQPNVIALKDISNRIIHNASIFQDEHSVSVAILIYSLSKIIPRVKGKFDYSKIKNLISLAIEYLEDDNVENYHDFIKKIFAIVSKTDMRFRTHIQEVINQASINKGSRLYEHGISASKTSGILGISLWDLYNYIGATNIPDIDKEISSVKDRLNFTRGLFS
jgi:hypothetical protein